MDQKLISKFDPDIETYGQQMKLYKIIWKEKVDVIHAISTLSDRRVFL